MLYLKKMYFLGFLISLIAMGHAFGMERDDFPSGIDLESKVVRQKITVVLNYSLDYLKEMESTSKTPVGEDKERQKAEEVSIPTLEEAQIAWRDLVGYFHLDTIKIYGMPLMILNKTSL
mgnify:CR=1 FL=1